MDLHGQIMNMTESRRQHDLYANTVVAYLVGHRDARHAAAELALNADSAIDAMQAQIDSLLRDAELVEVWMPIDEFVGIYEVSNIGRIRSLARTDTDGNKRQGLLLHPSLTPKGYLKVSLWTSNNRAERYVHRLVASAFIANHDNKPEVNHKDGDTKNNHHLNLEWVTTSENGKHRARVLKTGILKPVFGVSMKDKSSVQFESLQLAKDAGFTPSLIDKSIKGIRSHHKGYKWAYADAAIDAALSEESKGTI
jgi:hypothetical protein